MFADIEADIYVLADGDATYDASVAPKLIDMLLADRLDMVVGARKSEVETAYRRGHRLGNVLLTGILAQIFGRTFTDILSGYRIFSRRFVKSFPVLSTGFEIETEMSVHALELRMPVGEMVTAYAARPEGSVSKLSTYRDGWRILNMVIRLSRIERPDPFLPVWSVRFSSWSGSSSPFLWSSHICRPGSCRASRQRSWRRASSSSLSCASSPVSFSIRWFAGGSKCGGSPISGTARAGRTARLSAAWT